MKLAIVGSRGIHDKLLVVHGIAQVMQEFPGDKITEIVSGGAHGVDTMAESYALSHGMKCVVFQPDWEKHGKRAGYLRNIDIVSRADVVLAIWDGESKGTLMSINLAKQQRKPCIVIQPSEFYSDDDDWLEEDLP